MENLIVLENELVPVYETSTGEKVVYGTELHKVLEVKTPYRIWAERRFSDCDVRENEDFQAVQICTPSGQTKKDHIIRLDTAKEMAMLERNDKGKQVRRYFIKVEKKYKELKNELSQENQLILSIVNASDKIERAVALSEYKEVITTPLLETIEEQKETIEEQDKRLERQRPFVKSLIQLTDSSDTVSMKQVSDLICGNGIKIGRNKMMELLREHGFLAKNNDAINKYIKQGIFRVVQTEKIDEYGRSRIYPVTRVTPKGVVYIDSKLRKWLGIEDSGCTMEEFDALIKEETEKEKYSWLDAM